MKKLFVYTFALFCLMQIVACGGGVWVIKGGPVPLDVEFPIENMSTIDSHPLRKSPRVKYFRHLDFDIYKRCGGSEWNVTFCPKRVMTTPGKIQIGIANHMLTYIYYPEIEFEAKLGQKYFLTWACAPHPIGVIADAETLKIIAVESFCPNCDELIGAKIEADNQCVGYSLHPQWMQPDDKKHWGPWAKEVASHGYIRLCNAADQGQVKARLQLALKYLYGSGRIEENHVLAYVWLRLAESSGSKQAVWEAENLKKKLSPSNLEKAEMLLDDWRPGQCEAQVPSLDKTLNMQIRNQSVN